MFLIFGQADDIANLIVNILQTPVHVQIHDILVRPTEQQF
jgi:NADP-dependent 3-hydroxy acid dehydrogenase YdfG